MSKYTARDLMNGIQIAKLASPICCIQLHWEQVAVIIAQLQLAQRHPGNTGLSCHEARVFIRGTIDSIEHVSPLLAAVLREGNDAANDVPSL